MARISFTGHLTRHLACPDADAPGATVAEVLEAVFADNPRLRGYLLDDQGRVRKHVNIFINDEAIADRDGLSDPVAEGDEIFVFQALSGG
jgi:molybdopterin converting factor small subunit